IAIGVFDVGSQYARVSRGFNVIGHNQLTVFVGCGNGDVESTSSTAVFFSDNNVLGDVDKTTSQVTGVCRLQRGIGQAFTSTVSCGEVFQHRQTLTIGGLDRTWNNLTLWVSYKSTDTGN